MQFRHFTLARGLLFALLCFSSAQALALGSTFDIAPQIELGHTREQLAEHWPSRFRSQADKALQQINDSYVRLAPGCRRNADGLAKTRIYLQTILDRIVFYSHLEKEINSAYGVCVMPLPKSDGLFASLFDVPMLREGVIRMPVTFLKELKTEEELAFVIGHELSHFLLKHEVFMGFLQATHQMKDSNNEFSTQSEREADELGMRLIVNAGYDLNVALITLEKLRANDATHPHAEELESMRSKLFTEMKRKKIRYAPMQSGAYLTPEILAEIEGAANTQVSDASN